MKPRAIVVLGAGGFAREVEWLISEINTDTPSYDFKGFVVTDLNQLTETDSRDRVLGDYHWLEENLATVDCLALGIGTPRARRRVGEELSERFPGLDFPPLLHPTVHLDHGSCEIGPGVLICAGTIGTVNLRLGPFAMVNLACTLGHEADLGAGAVLNPTVNISGGVTIGNEVLIGTGSQVLQYIEIGDGATVGAGAVVTQPVAAGQTVVGVPAKPIGRAS